MGLSGPWGVAEPAMRTGAGCMPPGLGDRSPAVAAPTLSAGGMRALLGTGDTHRVVLGTGEMQRADLGTEGAAAAGQGTLMLPHVAPSGPATPGAMAAGCVSIGERTATRGVV